MSSRIPLLPPERLHFTQSDTWPRGLEQFEQFCVASGIAERVDLVQISTLMYAMGEKAEILFASFGMSEDEGASYNTFQA